MTNWPSRYEAFAARKERDARSADLHPFRTESIEAGAPLVEIGNDWSRRLFDGPFFVSPEPSVSLVFVQSADGNTGADDPASLGGGETDKHLVYEGLSRVDADGVLAGAETVRGGDILFSVWHPEIVSLRSSLGKPRHPVQIVATLRGLPLHDGLLFNVPEIRVVVLTVPTCADLMSSELASRPWIQVEVMSSARDLPAAVAGLARQGIARISAVGGRSIARTLIDAGAADHLYLTTSAKSGGQPNTPLYPRPLPGRAVVRKHGTGPDAGVVFEQIRLKKSGRAS